MTGNSFILENGKPVFYGPTGHTEFRERKIYFSDGDVLDVAHVTVSAAEPEKTDKASTVLEDEIDAQASASS